MLYNSFVSLSIDSFIEDKDSTIWIAKLNNGETVYQDDDRPGFEPSSWHRLRNYCYDNGLYIKNISLKFRSHTENVGYSPDGYFFIKSLLGSLSDERQKTFHYYKFGTILNKKISVQKWSVPELILSGTQERVIDNNSQKCIIWNHVEEQNRQKQIQV